MTKIRFTLGDSPVWHVIEVDYKLSMNQIKDEEMIAYFIKQEQDNCKYSMAKKVEIMDDNENVIAQSPAIVEPFKFEYKNEEHET